MVGHRRGAPVAFTRSVAVLGVVLGAVFALAFSTVAMAAGDDRATTEALLKEVDSSPRKDVAEPMSSRARAALDRAAKLRTSGDETHARLADGVARSWAEAARDVARAAVVEESAANTRRAANDAGVVADRERALLEEAVAQSGRLRAQLEAAEHEGKDQPARTSTAAAKDTGTSKSDKSDAGAPKAPAAPAPRDGARDGGAR